MPGLSVGACLKACLLGACLPGRATDSIRRSLGNAMHTAGKLRQTVEQAIEPGLPVVRALFIGAILASIFAAIATNAPMGRSLAWPLVVKAACEIVVLAECLLQLWTMSSRLHGSRGREAARLAL